MCGNKLTEIEQDQPRKDLLADEFRLFCVKAIHADGIFQLPERRFDSPPQVIELLERNGRKFVFGKIRHQVFVGPIRKADADSTESQIIKRPVVRVTKVKDIVFGKDPVSLRIFMHQGLDGLRLFFCQRNGHSAVKFPAFGQIKLVEDSSGG